MKMRTGKVAMALLAVAARSSTVQASPSLRASHLQMKDVDIFSSCHSPAPGVDQELKTTSFAFTITQVNYNVLRMNILLCSPTVVEDFYSKYHGRKPGQHSRYIHTYVNGAYNA